MMAAGSCQQLLPPLSAAEAESLPSAIVCVTGASGYVASHIVKRLLCAGATVHATVRNLRRDAAWAHLTELEGAAERLKFFEADLLKPGSFNAAVVGCTAVVHTASPFIISLPKGQARQAVVDPAVEGVRSVLGAVARTSSVRCVVLTSSSAAAFTDPWERGQGHVFTEEDWNLILQQPDAADGPMAYFYAKAAAEQEAYILHARMNNKLPPGFMQATRDEGEIAGEPAPALGEPDDEQRGWRLVSICPPGVFGPPLSARAEGESVSMMLRMLKGRMPIFAPPMGMGTIDVRDVAAAHCRALVNPHAHGRYLLNARSSYFLLLAAKVIGKEWPHLANWLPFVALPKWAARTFGPFLGLPAAATDAMHGKRPAISTRRAAEDLGMREWIQPEQSALEMAAACMEMGMV